MMFGFGLVAKVVLVWTIVFFIAFFNTFHMMVTLLTLGVIGIVLALGVKQIEHRLLRWRPEHRERT